MTISKYWEILERVLSSTGTWKVNIVLFEGKTFRTDLNFLKTRNRFGFQIGAIHSMSYIILFQLETNEIQIQ